MHIRSMLLVCKEDGGTTERYMGDKLYCGQASPVKAECDLYNGPEDWIRNDGLAMQLQDTVNLFE